MSPDDSDQLTRSLRSDCKALQSVMGSMLLKSLVSSATLDVLTVFGRSSTNNRNNIGPNKDPCGIPNVTGNSREVAPKTVTCCLRPVSMNGTSREVCQ